MACDPADRRWMELALALGRRNLGQTWPNPAVGCVIVKDGHVVGRGWTGPGGVPHGETMALAQAGARARDATAFVTLEPCAHHGKTPPCADALIMARVARVVIAIQDPDPRVAGKGISLLRRAGIAVETGCLARRATRDHAGFLQRIQKDRPLVTLKLATSLDGRIATGTGESRWITGAAARRHGHYLRAVHDAVLIGAGTAIADDPMLNVRGLGTRRQPVRVICDSRLSVPTNGQLGQSARDNPVWPCHTRSAPPAKIAAWRALGGDPIACAADRNGRPDIRTVLSALAARGITRVFCEGGGQMAAALLSARAVDQVVVFGAGLALGADAIPAVAPLAPTALAEYERFGLHEVREIGADVISVWRKD